MVSPFPSWLSPADTTIGLPPNWEMPASKENRVRVDVFIKQHRNAQWSLQGPHEERLFFQLSGEVEHVGLLAGRKVVVSEEMPDWYMGK